MSYYIFSKKVFYDLHLEIYKAIHKKSNIDFFIFFGIPFYHEFLVEKPRKNNVLLKFFFVYKKVRYKSKKGCTYVFKQCSY